MSIDDPPLRPESATQGDPSLSEYVEPARSRRRRPAPKANPFFRFLFPLIIIALGAWVFLLWREGTKAVLDSTDGEVIEIVTDPDAPGYEVFVDPTPTLLVVHLEDDRLVGVTVLARTLLDNGGQGVLLGADFAIDGAAGTTLAQHWQQGGITSLEAEVGGLFGFGFTETDLVPADELARFLELVEPIPLNVLDDLVAVDGDGTTSVFLGSGGQLIGAADAARVYGWRNPGEFEANRTERQLDVWQSWIQEIAGADDPAAAALSLPDGLSPYLLGFAVGRFDLQLAPAIPAGSTADSAVYVLDDAGEAWLADLADRMVPLPVAPAGTSVPTIRLLDGTGSPATREAALAVLVDLAEVAIFGNATEFGLETTRLLHHRPESEAVAIELGAAIGAEVVFSDEPDQPVDLTVVIGTDWETP